MGNCKPKTGLSESPIFFYKEVGTGNNDLGKEMKEKVKLNIELRNITNNSNYKVTFFVYKDKSNNTYLIKETTESASKDENNCIKFKKFVSMEYYFEREQPLKFQINDNEIIQTTLGNIMGSRGLKLIKKLNNGEELIIQANKLSDINTNIIIESSIKEKAQGLGISYLIKYLGTSTNPLNNPVYRSEILKIFPAKFQKTLIPSYILAPDGKFDNNIISIELTDNIHNKTLGEINQPLSQFFSTAPTIPFKTTNEAIFTIKSEKVFSFIDYLRGGMQINLTIGIDFTGSNGDPQYSNSLHYIGSNLNQYEAAIRSCGDIVAYYDYDQLFPVYGYGFAFKSNRQTLHCFPINENTDDPNINTIDGVLSEYRKFIQKVILSGPTNFAPLINELNKTVKEELKEGKKMNYNILMILTDGQISDMRETKDALVEASFLPISVIIIGIGNNNFDNMDVLDADDNPLYDRNGRKADRDLVQFVPFNKFKNSPEKLAEEVLEEVPRQVVEYYQHNNIFPLEPNVVE
jgi:hypothetical protein